MLNLIIKCDYPKNDVRINENYHIAQFSLCHSGTLCNDKKITISVIDTGIGMDTKDIEMAMSGKGKEIDKSQLIKFGKTIDSHGIGLPLVKKLVEDQNGTIDIKSQLGIGTEVVLKF